MEKCKLKLSSEEKKSTKIRRRTEFHIDNPGATNQGRPGEVAEYRIPVFKYLKIPDTHVETG